MKKSCIVFILLTFFFWPQMRSVFAADYDLYVDEDADSGGDGSKGDPFREIEDALGEAGSGDTIYVKSGSYDGGFVVGKNVKIQGESESKVEIEGGITLNDGSRLANLTISEGSTAVMVKKGSSVTIDECTIKEFSKIGINIAAGNGKLVVKDSNIENGSGAKGLYIEYGNKIELSNSKIHDNSQEGVDIRANVDGFIIGNQIYDNGESGIEVILGSADLLIKDNRIEDNGSSGIATQYYSDSSKLGGVKIKGNDIEKNKKFGIDCNVPHAGAPSANYWSKSLDVEENQFSGNKKGRISSYCKLVEADEGDGGEEYDEDTQSQEASNEHFNVQEKMTEKEKEQEELAELEKRQEQETQFKNDFEQIQQDLNDQLAQSNELAEKMLGRNGFWLWVKGPSKEDDLELERASSALSMRIAKLDAIHSKTSDDNFKQQLGEKRKILDEAKIRLNKILTLDKKRFSFWGWILKIAS